MPLAYSGLRVYSLSMDEITFTLETRADLVTYLAKQIQTLIDWDGCLVESIKVGSLAPIFFAEDRARFQPFEESGQQPGTAVGSHTLCARGEDYAAAADRLAGMAFAKSEAVIVRTVKP